MNSVSVCLSAGSLTFKSNLINVLNIFMQGDITILGNTLYVKFSSVIYICFWEGNVNSLYPVH